jgi:alanine dehydrogenase
LPEECDLFRENQILFTYLHLAANETLTRALIKQKIIGIAYETISPDNGTLPCLRPMSEIAGRLAVQEAAKYLERPQGGLGILLPGVPGVRRAKVAILGGGTVGTNAAKIAIGIGADVSILDISAERLIYLDDIFSHEIQTLYSSRENIELVLKDCDALIGAVLLPGASAPKLVKRHDLALMKPGSVIVDVAVDQGGCVETTRPTTHTDPVYTVDGILHYCVANMPGAVPVTSTAALTSNTLPYGLQIADLGAERAIQENNALKKGLNLYSGKLTNKAVADSLNIKYEPV